MQYAAGGRDESTLLKPETMLMEFFLSELLLFIRQCSIGRLYVNGRYR